MARTVGQALTGGGVGAATVGVALVIAGVGLGDVGCEVHASARHKTVTSGLTLPTAGNSALRSLGRVDGGRLSVGGSRRGDAGRVEEEARGGGPHVRELPREDLLRVYRPEPAL